MRGLTRACPPRRAHRRGCRRGIAPSAPRGLRCPPRHTTRRGVLGRRVPAPRARAATKPLALADLPHERSGLPPCRARDPCARPARAPTWVDPKASPSPARRPARRPACTAVCVAAGALARLLLAREQRHGRSGGIAARAGTSACSTSACFQRSTPSTRITRRPTINVIAASAPATPSGSRGSASSASTLSGPPSRSASPRRSHGARRPRRDRRHESQDTRA